MLDGWERPPRRRGVTAPTPGAASRTPTSSWRSRTRSGAAVCRYRCSRTAQRVPAGRHRHALRHVGRRARLLPAIGESGRPAGAAHRRLRRPGAGRASDAVCTALQLTNFWQDLAIDWRRGRLYVPAEIWQPARCARGRPRRRGGSRPSGAPALATVAARTRALFTPGRRVCDGVDGRLRFELRATWLGGMRILDRLERPRIRRLHAPAVARRARTPPAIAWRVADVA